MKFETFVAGRYLSAKRKQAFIGVISLITFLGIVLGVTALNLALSIHNGMQDAFMSSLIGKTGQFYILPNMVDRNLFSDDELSELELLFREAPSYDKYSILHSEPGMFIAGKNRMFFGYIKGIDPEKEKDMASPVNEMKIGSLRGLEPLQMEHPSVSTTMRPGIVLGWDMAQKLNVGTDDVIRVFFPRVSSPGLASRAPQLKSRKFRVVGIFKSGKSEYDTYNAFIHINEMERILNLKGIGVVQVKLIDSQAMDEAKSFLQKKLPLWARLVDMRDVNSKLLKALALEKWGTTLIVSLIIMIAGLNMISALIMMVMEKHRDIGIMRSMGASRKQVIGIFLRQGMTLAVRGTIVGTILGVALAEIADRTKLIRVDNDVYEVLSYLPFQVHFLEVVAVALGSLLIAFLASLYPAYQAGSLDPVEALKYE